MESAAFPNLSEAMQQYLQIEAQKRRLLGELKVTNQSLKQLEPVIHSELEQTADSQVLLDSENFEWLERFGGPGKLCIQMKSVRNRLSKPLLQEILYQAFQSHLPPGYEKTTDEDLTHFTSSLTNYVYDQLGAHSKRSAVLCRVRPRPKRAAAAADGEGKPKRQRRQKATEDEAMVAELEE